MKLLKQEFNTIDSVTMVYRNVHSPHLADPVSILKSEFVSIEVCRCTFIFTEPLSQDFRYTHIGVRCVPKMNGCLNYV